ncbi:DUF4124 domain-containing protein [Cupriavidus pampae]|uniref:DUF4124 domain-containing protein n=1 Tax=Cupriavidus pampae TaxID=659251 RepID=UPI001CC618DE
MRTIFVLLCLWSTASNAATIYQCRDPRGQVVLQDRPCAEGAPERVVRSGQDIARERYLAADGDGSQAYARGLLYGISCRTAFDGYNAARRSQDVAAKSDDLRRLRETNEAVARAGRHLSELGC